MKKQRFIPISRASCCLLLVGASFALSVLGAPAALAADTQNNLTPLKNLDPNPTRCQTGQLEGSIVLSQSGALYKVCQNREQVVYTTTENHKTLNLTVANGGSANLILVNGFEVEQQDVVAQNGQIINTKYATLWNNQKNGIQINVGSEGHLTLSSTNRPVLFNGGQGTVDLTAKEIVLQSTNRPDVDLLNAVLTVQDASSTTLTAEKINSSGGDLFLDSIADVTHEPQLATLTFNGDVVISLNSDKAYYTAGGLGFLNHTQLTFNGAVFAQGNHLSSDFSGQKLLACSFCITNQSTVTAEKGFIYQYSSQAPSSAAVVLDNSQATLSSAEVDSTGMGTLGLTLLNGSTVTSGGQFFNITVQNAHVTPDAQSKDNNWVAAVSVGSILLENGDSANTLTLNATNNVFMLKENAQVLRPGTAAMVLNGKTEVSSGVQSNVTLAAFERNAFAPALQLTPSGLDKNPTNTVSFKGPRNIIVAEGVLKKDGNALGAINAWYGENQIQIGSDSTKHNIVMSFLVPDNPLTEGDFLTPQYEPTNSIREHAKQAYAIVLWNTNSQLTFEGQRTDIIGNILISHDDQFMPNKPIALISNSLETQLDSGGLELSNGSLASFHSFAARLDSVAKYFPLHANKANIDIKGGAFMVVGRPSGNLIAMKADKGGIITQNPLGFGRIQGAVYAEDPGSCISFGSTLPSEGQSTVLSAQGLPDGFAACENNPAAALGTPLEAPVSTTTTSPSTTASANAANPGNNASTGAAAPISLKLPSWYMTEDYADAKTYTVFTGKILARNQAVVRAAFSGNEKTIAVVDAYVGAGGAALSPNSPTGLNIRAAGDSDSEDQAIAPGLIQLFLRDAQWQPRDLSVVDELQTSGQQVSIDLTANQASGVVIKKLRGDVLIHLLLDPVKRKNSGMAYIVDPGSGKIAFAFTLGNSLSPELLVEHPLRFATTGTSASVELLNGGVSADGKYVFTLTSKPYQKGGVDNDVFNSGAQYGKPTASEVDLLFPHGATNWILSAVPVPKAAGYPPLGRYGLPYGALINLDSRDQRLAQTLNSNFNDQIWLRLGYQQLRVRGGQVPNLLRSAIIQIGVKDHMISQYWQGNAFAEIVPLQLRYLDKKGGQAHATALGGGAILTYQRDRWYADLSLRARSWQFVMPGKNDIKERTLTQIIYGVGAEGGYDFFVSPRVRITLEEQLNSTWINDATYKTEQASVRLSMVHSVMGRLGLKIKAQAGRHLFWARTDVIHEFAGDQWGQVALGATSDYFTALTPNRNTYVDLVLGWSYNRDSFSFYGDASVIGGAQKTLGYTANMGMSLRF